MTTEPPPTDSVRPQPPNDPHDDIHAALHVCLSNLKTLWVFTHPDKPGYEGLYEDQAREVIDGKLDTPVIDLRTHLNVLAEAEGTDEWRHLDAWQIVWAIVERIRPHFGRKNPWATSWGRVRAELLNWQPPPDFDRLTREADANLKRLRGLETPPLPPASPPVYRSAKQDGCEPSIDLSPQAIIARAKARQAKAVEMQLAQGEAKARFRRAHEAWERVRSFEIGRAGDGALEELARLVVELGRVLKEDGWQGQVDAVPTGTEMKT